VRGRQFVEVGECELDDLPKSVHRQASMPLASRSIRRFVAGGDLERAADGTTSSIPTTSKAIGVPTIGPSHAHDTDDGAILASVSTLSTSWFAQL
jgi:hypothetical protein